MQSNLEKAFVMITIVGVVLSVIALPNSIFGSVPSRSQSTTLPENISSFTFEIIGESGDYFIVRVVETHNAPEIKVGDILHIGKPQMPESVQPGETPG